MKHSRSILLGTAILIAVLNCFGQDSLQQKQYAFGIYNNYDLRNISLNAIGTYRAFNEGFDLMVTSKLKPRVGGIAKSVFNFSTIYLTMLWSHEFGHAIRAKQVGGKFNFHNFGLPVPYTTADLPSDISLIDEAIFVTAGFEVNYLNIKQIQSQFIRQNGISNEDLAFSFANRLMYPIYTSLIVRIDPKEKDVWIETAGDPVHYVLPVFKNYADNQVFMADSTVNTQLVKLYSQANLFAQLFHFLDPQFYREIGAAFGNSTKIRKPIFLIGDYDNGWTYGTLFNASPLGYELYFQNYIHLKDKQYGLYFKYGRPFKNMGIGLSMNNIINWKKLQSDVLVEAWSQDIFGDGVSIEFNGQWKVNEMIGISYNLGYKTEGYLLGKQLGSGLNIGTGICLYSK